MSLFIGFRPKLCGNCSFLQNYHTKKLGEITVFYAVIDDDYWTIFSVVDKFSANHIKYYLFINTSNGLEERLVLICVLSNHFNY